MKQLIICLFLLSIGYSQRKTIHVFVSLCDNEHQGIVKVPEQLGDGQKPSSNLYWGALYGVKTHFKKAKEWKLIYSLGSRNPIILERLLFKHVTKDVYLLADAYDGRNIKDCMEDFLMATNGQKEQEISYQNKSLTFGGKSNLVAFIGHNGLMDTSIDVNYVPKKGEKIETIILACKSKEYFTDEVKKANGDPLLWTTNYMAPEAYVLKAAIDGWILKETKNQVAERAAQAYNNYQKCGITGARRLFTSGF